MCKCKWKNLWLLASEVRAHSMQFAPKYECISFYLSPHTPHKCSKKVSPHIIDVRFTEMHFCVHSAFIGACCHANFPFLSLALHYRAWFQCRPAAIPLQNSSLSVYWPKAILMYLFSKVHSKHFLFQYYGCSHGFSLGSWFFFFLHEHEQLMQSHNYKRCVYHSETEKYTAGPKMV